MWYSSQYMQCVGKISKVKITIKNVDNTLTFQKHLCYLLDWKPFKSDEKSFLFYLKSSFHSQDILVFVTTFRSCRKNDLIRKTRLISRFMTSQPGLQAIAIHVLPNISRNKDNLTIKFSQLIEYNKRNILLQNLSRKWGKKTSFRPLFIFQKIWGESKYEQTG